MVFLTVLPILYVIKVNIPTSESGKKDYVQYLLSNISFLGLKSGVYIARYFSYSISEE